MNRPGPPPLAVVSGALLGATLATFTPGLGLIAQALDALHAQRIATPFQLVLASWGAVLGAVVVREQSRASSRKSLLLVALYPAVFALTGLVYTLSEVAHGGREAFAALLLLGAISLGVSLASLLLAIVTRLLVRRLALGLADDATRPANEAESSMATRASRWVLAAALAQVSTGLFGGPVLVGALAAGASVWLFRRARAGSKAALGMSMASLVALVGLSVQASLWADEQHGLVRAALPACADAESDPVIPGAYGKRARMVPGVLDVLALLRLDKSKSPSVVYQVVVSVVADSESNAASVRRAVEAALVSIDCDEGSQLRRVPPLVVAPVERPLEIEATVRLGAGVGLARAQAELEPKVRAALARAKLSASGPRLSLPTVGDLAYVEALSWRVNGIDYTPGETLPSSGDAELPVLHSLVVKPGT